MLIVPEIEEGLAPETVSELLEYAKNGGSLLLVGNKTCQIFADAGAPYQVEPVKDADEIPVMKIVQTNKPEYQRFFTLDGSEFGGAIRPVRIEVREPDRAEVLASPCYDYRGIKHPYAAVMPYGEGKVAAIGGNIGTQYNQEIQSLLRVLIRKLADKLYTPQARIESVCGMLEIVCLEKDGKLMLQLVNANGNHANPNCATEDIIPPLLDIEISIACEKEPVQMTLQPAGKALAFEYRNGRAYVKVDRVDMHSVIEVTE